MECIAVHHVAFEDLGSFAAPLRERGYGISYRHAGAEPLRPEEWLRADLVAVLDGLAGLPVLHWHGDNIVLPTGLAALASTPGTPCQAFALGDYALGLQFHAEFAGRALEAWLTGHAVELAYAGVDLARLRADTARHAAGLERGGAPVLRRWLDGIT